MPIHIVRLGSPRRPGEGTRFGTVRFPPRGIPKSALSERDFYDLWLPVLAPSAELLGSAREVTDERGWRRFSGRYRREMAASDPAGVLDALAKLSATSRFAVGCYCVDESRCHRSLLREMFLARGADVVPGS